MGIRIAPNPEYHRFCGELTFFLFVRRQASISYGQQPFTVSAVNKLDYEHTTNLISLVQPNYFLTASALCIDEGKVLVQ